jgi:Protein of unknown function, DUF488
MMDGGDYPPPEVAEQMRNDLFSVGHSNHDLAGFLALLRGAGVTALADVRSSPFSQRLPHFNRPALEAALRDADVAYVFLGDLLGGRPADRALYDNDGRVDYDRVRATDAFRRGLDRLLDGAELYRVVLLCAEADPLDCHRGLMITPALGERGVFPQHLRRDGTVESTEEMERRLLAETGAGGGMLAGMFAGLVTEEERRQLLAEAYRARARRKGYRKQGEGLESRLSPAGTPTPQPLATARASPSWWGRPAPPAG